MTTGSAAPDHRQQARDRDLSGRARNARPRDRLGRPLPHGSAGVERAPEGVWRTPARTLHEGRRLLATHYPFHAHEVFEDAWKQTAGPQSELWRALAQLAVGVTHAARGNPRGAARVLTRAAAGLDGFAAAPPYGIDAAGLAAWARDAAAELGVRGERGDDSAVWLTVPDLVTE